MQALAESLLVAIGELEVVDAHEHLWPEEYHLAHEQDVLTLIQYSLADLAVAGASPEEVRLLTAHREGPKAGLDERWQVFRKYLPTIKDTAPIRALFIALRDLYDLDVLNDETYREVSRHIAAERRPGLYKRMLRERCGITCVLNQNPRVLRSDGFLLPIRNIDALGAMDCRPALDDLARRSGVEITDLQSLLWAATAMLDGWDADGTVGIKRAGRELGDPTRQEAEAALRKALDAAGPVADAGPARDFVEHEIIEEAGRRGRPVSVHTGLWAGAWADVRTARPEHLIDIARKHRDTRFDVYHAGMPWVSVLGIMARQLPNLWLNLCWSHVVSPVMTRRALDEWLDVIPVSKIIGWGGDYWMSVEKVYGHLVMARENIAEVLAGRIDRGLMTESRAIEIAGMMLAENPARLYGLR